MKSPLVYLTATKLKNQLIAVVKSPAKLIYAVILVALFALTAFSGSAYDLEELRNPQELTAITVLFYTMMFLMVFASGSSSSNSPMFTLSDVMLLFPAPMSSNKILVYGLVRQLGLSLVLGFFILFQYSWMHGAYGIGPAGLVLIIVGYAITLFFAQLASMASYVRTSGMERAGKIVRYCVFGVAALYGVWAVLTCRQDLLALVNGAPWPLPEKRRGVFANHIPGILSALVSGWAAGLVSGIFAGNWLLVGSLPRAVWHCSFLLLGLILTCKNNYYEDVLSTAETAQSAVTAQKEGQLNEVVPKREGGKTAWRVAVAPSPFTYKHCGKLSGVFSSNMLSLIFMAVIIGCSFFMRDAGLVGIFAFATYMQLFSEALGRFNRELIKPYIYLIPEPPLKKLLYAIKESLLSDTWEAILIFLVVAIVGAPLLEIVVCMVAWPIVPLFTAGNVCVERVFGMVQSKTLIFLFYFLVLLLMAIPGIAACVVCSILLPVWGAAAGLLGMAVINAAIAVLVLWLCRNLLQYAELNSR